ncbi:MAG TPA: Tad domain-containing protein [Anaerolineales bacterium]|nr:Tad domain-containing protein [Anaerolineales bacterium]
MKTKLFSEKGQALILIALAAFGLFGMVGLAIDGSAKFSDRRHAQNAADTAAMAGALELARDRSANWTNIARNVATNNGYDGSLAGTNQVWVHYCDAISAQSPVDCGPYNGYHNYVQVVIKSRVKTSFARVIGIEETTNTVQAVTHWSKAGPTFGPEILKSLNPNNCTGDNGNIVFGGNGDITLNGGGAYINSGGSCGMELTGCGNLNVIGGSLSSAGTGNINLTTSSGHCAASINVPTPSYNAEPTLFTPEMPPEPDECNSSDPSNWGHWTNVGETSYVEPGWYLEFPPQKTSTQDIKNNIVMNPGVYCVDSVVKLQDRHLVLTGHNVTIYIRQGGQFDVQGGHVELDAPDAPHPYAGYLIIINSDFAGTPPNCTINGDSTNIYIGTIFAPFCDFIFNGTNEAGDPDLTYGTQVVAYTITLTGNSDINFTYSPGAVAQSQPKVGLMR